MNTNIDPSVGLESTQISPPTLDDALTEREPDAGSGEFVLGVKTLKYFEDMFLLVGLDSNLFVVD